MRPGFTVGGKGKAGAAGAGGELDAGADPPLLVSPTPAQTSAALPVKHQLAQAAPAIPPMTSIPGWGSRTIGAVMQNAAPMKPAHMRRRNHPSLADPESKAPASQIQPGNQSALVIPAAAGLDKTDESTSRTARPSKP